MSNFKKLFSIIVLLLIFITSSNSNEPVAYVDIDFIIKNSDVGKRSLEKIDKLNQENIKNFKEKEKILKDLEIQITGKKNIISKEAFNKELISFKAKVDEFKIEQKKIIKNFNDFKKKEIDEVFQKITPIINSFMENQSIKILFDSKNIFMARNDLNLTKNILNKINKEAK